MSNTDVFKEDIASDFISQEYVKETPLYSGVDKILKNGINNLYPNEIEGAINNSAVATQCANTYQTFLAGSGFDVEDINLGYNDWDIYTCNDFLSDVCHSISRHGGVFIHVTYDGNLVKRKFEVLPYQNCRIGKVDDQGYVSNIVYRPKGWSRRNYYNGFTQNTSNKKEVYLPYDPRPQILEEQIAQAGSIEEFNGQVLYYKIEKKYPYSRSLLDSALHSSLVDFNLGLYYFNLTRGGFQDIKLLRHARFKSENALNKFKREVRDMVGVKNANSVLLVQDKFTADSPNGSFRVEDLGSSVDASKYEHLEQVLSSKLRRAFLNIPHQLIEQTPGKLASTSELIEAIAIYNASTASHRTKIERVIRALFDNFYYTRNGVAVPFPVLKNIRLYSLLSDGSIIATPDNPTPSPTDTP